MRSSTLTSASAAACRPSDHPRRCASVAKRSAREAELVDVDLVVVLADRRRPAAVADRRRARARERAGIADAAAELGVRRASASSRAPRAAALSTTSRVVATGAIRRSRSSAACSSSALVLVRVKAATTSFTRSNSANDSSPVKHAGRSSATQSLSRVAASQQPSSCDPVHQAARERADRRAEEEGDRHVAVARREDEADRRAARAGRRPRRGARPGSRPRSRADTTGSRA